MLRIDYWYGHTREDITTADMWFSDCDCVYRGNIYKGTQIIGDYVADNSTELNRVIEENFKNRKQKGDYYVKD